MAVQEMHMTVNGEAVSKTAPTHLRLLDFLRDELHLTGSKEGCGAGECGTCSVFVDGVLKKSCLIPVAKAQGSEIVTVEGLQSNGNLTVLQQAFRKTNGSQCGYCTPGFVMAATAVLRRNPEADQEQIKEGLGGTLCRCTGYQKIVEAVELARDVMNGKLDPGALVGEQDREAESFIGASVTSLDAPEKVTGMLRYAGDMSLGGLLHLKVLRSPVAHARIAKLDVSRAESAPGVHAVITHADVPGLDGHGMLLEIQPVLAGERVRFMGEGVAAVVADTPQLAEQALELIEVRYEELPAVFDMEVALEPGAPELHEDYPGNLIGHLKVRKGDVERGFAEADVIVEEDYYTQRTEHAYLEPEAGLSYLEPDGTLMVVSPSQNVTHHRQLLSKILDMPPHKIRLIVSPIGGGFGGKEDLMPQSIMTLATLKTGRPVKYVLTREESLTATTKRHPFRIRCKTGIRADGRITASSLRMVLDGGAYGGTTPGVATKALVLGAGPYAIENVRVDTYGVFTNNTPSGAKRCFGGLQPQFATEVHMDLCAERMGMDPVEFRRINAMRDGAITHTRQQIGPVSMLKTLEAATGAAGWTPAVPFTRGPHRTDLGRAGTRQPCALDARLHPAQGSGYGNGNGSGKRADTGARKSRRRVRGRGVASCWYGTGLTGINDRSSAWVELDDGGTAKVLSGAIEMGQGIANVIAQIAAQELGIRPGDVALGAMDSSHISDIAHAAASRQTYLIGNAVAEACRNARLKLDEEVAKHWGVSPKLIRVHAGQVSVFDRNLAMPMDEAVRICRANGVVPVGMGSYSTIGSRPDPEDGRCQPWQTYVFGAQVAEVEVDTGTGEVQVLGVWACHDVGRIINPKGVESQIEGCVVMALGQALMEEYVLDEGRPVTPNFAKYILPTSLDVPQVTTVLIDEPDPTSKLGVKGLGEPAMIPTAPAIINAIHDAVGVRITELPATPEKVLAALRAKAN